LPGFVVQFGINGNPTVQSNWRNKSLPDDIVKTSNRRGTVVFATAGPNSRTTQLFINTRPQGNAFLDQQGFSPIGRVIEGM
jgi:peptidyl-prolyl cis-trans isomerase A (cyclophilin A)